MYPNNNTYNPQNNNPNFQYNNSSAAYMDIPDPNGYNPQNNGIQASAAPVNQSNPTTVIYPPSTYPTVNLNSPYPYDQPQNVPTSVYSPNNVYSPVNYDPNYVPPTTDSPPSTMYQNQETTYNFSTCPPNYDHPPPSWNSPPIPCGYNVIVTFLGATGLPIGDIVSSDPYLKVEFNGIKYQTKVIFKTLNPVWNEVWSLTNVIPSGYINFSIWDSDWLKADDPIGECSYFFDGKEGEYSATTPVIFNNKPHGQLQLKFQVWPSTVPGPMRSLNYVKFTRFTSKLAGVLQSNVNDDQILSYSLYSIYFPSIPTIFKNKKQHWNENYTAAQQIFGKFPHSILARQVVRSEHYFLYKHDHTAKYGYFQSGEDFIKLLNYGKRKGKNRFFNYAIIEDSFNFSETSADFFKDFMSKHAVLSGCVEEVYYSGEFHFEQDPVDGHYKLLIDNNSGTYAPDKNMLPCVAELFKSSFPDLDVEAVDRSDPRIAQFKKDNGIPT